MRAMDRVRYILVLVLLVVIVLAVVYRQELGIWMMEQFAGETTSQLQELLR